MRETLIQAIQQREDLLLLDGPTGTRLAHYGFPVDRPGWSARVMLEAPELLAQVHQEYLQAGSRLITANTFRTHEFNVQTWGQTGRGAELTARAVEIARQVAGEQAWVLGSQAPLGDCYSPEQVPDREILLEQHAAMAAHLANAQVDAVLLETHVSGAELLIAAEAVTAQSLPFLASVTSPDGVHLLDGTPLSELFQQLMRLQPLAIGVNCVPVERVADCLMALQTAGKMPLMVYANSGELTKQGEWRTTLGADVAVHTEMARDWLAAGVRILGGCCGTTPALIANFSRLLCGDLRE